MSIDECIKAYIGFQKRFIQKPATLLPIDIRGRVIPRYRGESLEKEIKQIIQSRAVDEDELLQEAELSTAVTYETPLPTSIVPLPKYANSAIVAQRVVDSHIDVFSSHPSVRSVVSKDIRIWEAARATTVAIGPYQVRYLDGGTGANNPVNQTVQSARDIWPGVEIACLVSVGSGIAPAQWALTRHSGIDYSPMSVATDMEDTAQAFARINRNMVVDDRYIRFNVTRRLERFYDDDSSVLENIIVLTGGYLQEVATQNSIERCAGKLRR
jgi:hypothetical protein